MTEPLPKKAISALTHEENKRHNKMILEKFYEENAELYKAQPEMINGLTEEQTDATMSVKGLTQPEPDPQEIIAKWIKANTEHREWYICPKCSHQTPRWKDEWVGLTDEEINTIYEQAEVLVNDSWVGNGAVGLMFPITLYKMFETKLKEKNS